MIAKRLVLCAFLGQAWFCLAGEKADSDKPSAARRPTNVVLILIDDLSHYGIGAYGATQIGSLKNQFSPQTLRTPNIDALAHEGFFASHAFAYPLCENTRVALMSGKYNERNLLRAKALHESDITFGDVFQRAGYKTGLFGKWKQTRGTPSVPATQYLYRFGWDEFTAFDVATAQQRFINPDLVINGTPVSYVGRSDKDPHTGRRWYGPDIVNRHALQFIEAHRDQAFFLYYPMLLVHDEHQPTPDTQPPRIFDQFPERDGPKRGKENNEPRYIADMIAYTDKLVGRIVAKLDELTLRERTLIVLVGDNGTKEIFSHILPGNRIYPGRKGGNTDNGLHVPLILNMPNTIAPRAGKAYEGLVHITDIFPTIAEAAGIRIPNAGDLDGISFWPQVLGAAGEPRSYIHHWYIGNSDYREPDIAIDYVFNKDFKLYAPSKDFPDAAFFDLRKDLFEREGETEKKYRFGISRYSGIKPTSLNAEQQAARRYLQTLLEKHAIVDATSVAISPVEKALEIGETRLLSASTKPGNVTRNGIIWESSDPSVITINKFGEARALTAGHATVTAYSWSDAKPYANGAAPEYSRDGVKDQITLTVLNKAYRSQ